MGGEGGEYVAAVIDRFGSLLFSPALARHPRKANGGW